MNKLWAEGNWSVAAFECSDAVKKQIEPCWRGRVSCCRNSAEQPMRPMLMTALSACIGLLPAAMSHGIGSRVQRPLSTVVVGGMLIGPIMLLVVVPALRMMFVGGDDAPPPEGQAERREEALDDV